MSPVESMAMGVFLISCLMISGIAEAVLRAQIRAKQEKEKAERMAKEIAIMAEIRRVISSTLDIEEVYERFAAEALKLISYDSLVVNVKNHGKTRWMSPTLLGRIFPNGERGIRFP